MNLYEDQFSEIHNFPRCEKPSKSLIIASTGRSGSHMLGHALHETKKFGFPLEYANSANLVEWKRRLGIDDFQKVIAELQQIRTSTNGVFGIKIHYSQIPQFGGFSKLSNMFPNAHFILLSRKDVLGQAISLSIAKQTGVWISGQKPTNENPTFSYTDIDHSLRSSIIDTSAWRYTLAASGANFTELYFEDARKDLAKTIKSIADFVGVELDENDIPEQQVTRKQSNNRNREWRKKFVSEFNSSSELFPRRKLKLIKRCAKKLNRFLKLS